MASNEITKYDQELDTIPLGKLKPNEIDLFFSIITKMRDKRDDKIRFYFDELKALSDYHDKNSERFLNLVRSTYKKLMTLYFGSRSKSGLREEYFIIFSEFTIDCDDYGQYVDVQIYDKAIPLLNDLTTWVRYSLRELTSLRSAYSKTLFRLIKGFRTTGYYKIKKEDFNELMAIPKSYSQSLINARIVNPSVEELQPYFKNLRVKKEYAKTKGNPLKSYIFTFTPEPKDADDYQIKKGYKKSPRKEIATNWHSKGSNIAKSDSDYVNNLLETLEEK
ncbi:replication initiation protein [Holzapfeliella floricola]|uniref:Initiator Rep protein WH1 domain-containing protein n=2 Tax=Holzapfeliella TaxID=2767883 RepID=A0A0R2DJ11_9LACO|nr:replication initiation protein [Holzapfeliella floricola]KRN04062.1 hypothetical protein FC86_GL000593 [Holzapfeliella floricola DSM 23037 = JCM 16512]